MAFTRRFIFPLGWARLDGIGIGIGNRVTPLWGLAMKGGIYHLHAKDKGYEYGNWNWNGNARSDQELELEAHGIWIWIWIKRRISLVI